MCGVENESSRFGKIQIDFGKQFIVLWTDGSVSKESMPHTKKFVMNSPSFFALVSPGRNPQVFDSEPLQLVLEVLWEKRSLTPQSCALDIAKIGSAVLQVGVSKEKFEKARKALISDLKSDKRIKLKGTTYQIIVEEFEVHEPVSFDWAALEAEPIVIAKLASMANEVSGKGISIESLSSANLDQTWREFYLQTTGSSLEVNLPTEPDRILQIFFELEERFKKLDTKSRKFLASSKFDALDTTLGLLASWITGRSLNSETKVGKDTVNLALRILLAKNDKGNQSSAIDVALARLSELISEEDYLKAANTPLMMLNISKALATLPPGDYGYRARVALVAEVAKIVSKDSVSLTQKESDLLLQLIQSHGWGSSERKILNEALFLVNSEIIQEESFWNNLDLDSFEDLTESPHWKIIVGKEATGRLLSTAVANLLSRLSPSDSLAVLPYAESIAEAVGPDRIPDLLTRALTSTGSLSNALSQISNAELVVSLRSEADSLYERTLELELQLKSLTKQLDYSSQVVLELQSRLAAVAQERSGIDEQNREKFEIGAARSLARIMNVVEKYGGNEATKNEEVQAALAVVGLSSTARLGEVMEFLFEIHEDPEGHAVEGDSVLLIASGYRWTGSTESVVVQKALVSRVGYRDS